MPQMMPWQRCLHRPLMHTLESSHGLLEEQKSLVHKPPGKGFPVKPSTHLQVGPSEVGMH